MNDFASFSSMEDATHYGGIFSFEEKVRLKKEITNEDHLYETLNYEEDINLSELEKIIEQYAAADKLQDQQFNEELNKIKSSTTLPTIHDINSTSTKNES